MSKYNCLELSSLGFDIIDFFIQPGYRTQFWAFLIQAQALSLTAILIHRIIRRKRLRNGIVFEFLEKVSFIKIGIPTWIWLTFSNSIINFDSLKVLDTCTMCVGLRTSPKLMIYAKFP